MKDRKLLGWTLVGVALIAVGLLFYFTSGSRQYKMKTLDTIDPAAVRAIHVTAGSQAVYVYEAYDDLVKVEVSATLMKKIDWSLDNGLLELTVRGGKGSVDILVPPDILRELQVTVGSGWVSLSGLTEQEAAVTLNTGSGSASLYDTLCASLSMAAGSGSASVHDSSVLGETGITVGSGSVYLEDSTFGSLIANSASGYVSARAAASENMSVRTASGSVDMEEPAFSSAQVHTASGSVELLLTGSEADYTFDLSTVSGSIPALSGGGSRQLTADTVSGSIDIEFTEGEA